MAPHLVVVIVGSTGVGKSKLAVELAQRFDAEVLNADALQVYKGLDVTTNKIQESEALGIPHHLLGVESTENEYTALQFRDDAVKIIDEVTSRGRLPIIVGGSNYYVQALVSPYLLDERPQNPSGRLQRNRTDSPPPENPCCTAKEDELKELSPHEALEAVDPAAAARVHPNDTRKAQRYLEICRRTGRRVSEVFRSQDRAPKGSRYRCCWIWLDAEQGVLDGHLAARARGMFARGMLAEVAEVAAAGEADFTRGIRQAIGVREFGEFFGHLKLHGLSHRDVCELHRNPARAGAEAEGGLSPRGDCGDSACRRAGELLRGAFEEYVHSCSLLARRQRRRLSGLAARGEWPLLRLDATAALSAAHGPEGSVPHGSDPDAAVGDPWVSCVLQPAAAAVQAFLSSGGAPPAGSSGPGARQPDLWVQRTCEACGGKVLRGDNEWEAHVKGRNHRKRVASQRKREELKSSVPAVWRLD